MQDLMKGKFKMRDASGEMTEVDFHASEYQAAADAKLNLSQFLSQKYGGGTDEAKYGPVISQFMASAGMFLGTDLGTGLRSPSMKEIVNDGIQMGNVTRNDGSDRNSVAGRLLFPEIIMRTMEANLRDNNEDFLGGWNSMIAITDTINGPIFDQPLIDTSAPEGNRANIISQLALPDVMLSITTSSVPRRIHTRSIGVQISAEAQAATTLQLVNLAVAAQARAERIAMVEEDIAAIILGDTDRSSEAALSATTAETLDSTLSANGTISHKAWIKYLRANYRKRDINWIVCDLATALAIEARTGKPTRDTVYADPANGMGVDMTVDNLSVRAPRILIVDDGVIQANDALGLDSRFALRRVINVSAQYSAVEEFVLRRGSGFRIDYGEVTHRLYTDAFSLLRLTAS